MTEPDLRKIFPKEKFEKTIQWNFKHFEPNKIHVYANENLPPETHVEFFAEISSEQQVYPKKDYSCFMMFRFPKDYQKEMFEEENLEDMPPETREIYQRYPQSRIITMEMTLGKLEQGKTVDFLNNVAIVAKACDDFYISKRARTI